MNRWLRFLAWINFGNARRRLGGIKAAQTRKSKREAATESQMTTPGA